MHFIFRKSSGSFHYSKIINKKLRLCAFARNIARQGAKAQFYLLYKNDITTAPAIAKNVFGYLITLFRHPLISQLPARPGNKKFKIRCVRMSAIVLPPGKSAAE